MEWKQGGQEPGRGRHGKDGTGGHTEHPNGALELAFLDGCQDKGDWVQSHWMCREGMGLWTQTERPDLDDQEPGDPQQSLRGL